MKEIADTLLAFRNAGGLDPARSAALDHWHALQAEVGRAWDDFNKAGEDEPAAGRSATPLFGEIDHIENRFRKVLPAVAAWPELGLALLEEPQLERWRPTLIAEIAWDKSLRPDMIRRALALHPRAVELVGRFTEIGAAERDRALLDAAATLREEAFPGHDGVLARLAMAFADLGDLATATSLVVDFLARRGDPSPLLDLLRHTRCPLPEAAYERLVQIVDDRAREKTVSYLVEMGYTAEAERLAGLLLERGEGAKSLFAKPMLMATADPMGALDIIEAQVRRLPGPPGMVYMLELARLLDAVAITPATGPRVIELARLVTARPMREAIVARAKAGV